MRTLYEHDKVKCLVNIAHGEGFGLPLFEAARLSLPIITIPWSGQLDFLRHDSEDLFTKVAFAMKPVQDNAVWDGVVQKNSMWAYADEKSFKDALNWMVNNHEEALVTSNCLQNLIQAKFNTDKLYKGFCEAIWSPSDEELEWIDTKSTLELT